VKSAPVKTNAARILDRLKIAYEIQEYVPDENDLSAVHVAEQIDQPVERVYKTLVLQGDKTGHLVVIIPGAAELNLKKIAQLSQNKSCQMIASKDLLPLTGYLRGGCSPVGMKKQFPTYIDQTCLQFDFIFVSAGLRGAQLKLNPKDLIQAIQAKVVEL
jgi:Cys-tRNA(Pro)/Cys-tRNA(Cys) deacylase